MAKGVPSMGLIVPVLLEKRKRMTATQKTTKRSWNKVM
jgi:hypothetical protein